MRYHVSFAAAVMAVAGLAGCHQAPTVTATPASDLLDGQEIRVRGGGYSANATIGVVQCPAAADSLDDCDNDTAKTLSTDANGHFSTTMSVKRTIVDGHSVSTDCGASPGACVVVSVYVHGFADKAAAPLSFAR
jgi:hypothetical protein